MGVLRPLALARRARLALLPALALALAPPPAAAAPPRPPLVLPGAAGAAAAGSSWLVGARPGPAVAALAARFDARRLGPGPAWEVPRARARGFARALARRGRLLFAEPDRVLVRLHHAREEPLSDAAGWRDRVVAPDLVEPPVSDRSPLLAVLDSPVDRGHPEFAGASLSTTAELAVFDAHGTAVTAVAAAPVNGRGIAGVWPGARVLSVPLPESITCANSVRAIDAAVDAGAAVLNMSFGGPYPCFSQYMALQVAHGAGALPVAAAGNEFEEGNPELYPGAFPHVLTVAATDFEGRAGAFSTAHGGVDLAAPGVGVLTAVPAAHDPDSESDGYASLDGTSFAAPMVAAAGAWLRQARPRLDVGQVGDVLRGSARDLERPGWDPDTGWGAVDVGRALEQPTPPRDPSEPNDDIPFVDGTAFERPDPPVFGRRSRRATRRARLDVYEDPADVYRALVPARRSLELTVVPAYGDPDLNVFSGRAKHTGQRGRRLATSRRGRGRDRVRVSNRSRRARLVFVEVFLQRGGGLDAGYRLELRRRR